MTKAAHQRPAYCLLRVLYLICAIASCWSEKRRNRARCTEHEGIMFVRRPSMSACGSMKLPSPACGTRTGACQRLRPAEVAFRAPRGQALVRRPPCPEDGLRSRGALLSVHQRRLEAGMEPCGRSSERRTPRHPDPERKTVQCNPTTNPIQRQSGVRRHPTDRIDCRHLTRSCSSPARRLPHQTASHEDNWCGN